VAARVDMSASACASAVEKVLKLPTDRTDEPT
jgi:hypothetical protein